MLGGCAVAGDAANTAMSSTTGDREDVAPQTADTTSSDPVEKMGAEVSISDSLPITFATEFGGNTEDETTVVSDPSLWGVMRPLA